MTLTPVKIVAGKYRGRQGHIVRRWTHRASGVRYVDVQVRGEFAHDDRPRDFASFVVTPAWWFVVTAREERTSLREIFQHGVRRTQ